MLWRKLAELVDAQVLTQPLERGPAFVVRGDIGRASISLFPTIDQPNTVVTPPSHMYVLYPLRGRVQLFSLLQKFDYIYMSFRLSILSFTLSQDDFTISRFTIHAPQCPPPPLIPLIHDHEMLRC